MACSLTEAIDPKSVRNDTLIFTSRLCAISLHAKVCTLTRSCMYQQIKGLVLLFTNNLNVAHACLRPGSGHSLSGPMPLLINNNSFYSEKVYFDYIYHSSRSDGACKTCCEIIFQVL